MVIDVFLSRYKIAAGEGAVLELKLRMLAEKMPETGAHAHDRDLKDVEGAVLRHFEKHLSPEEKSSLELCRQLRNKLLHCDFHLAREKLRELGITPREGGVRMLRFKEGQPPANQISAALANDAGAFTAVAHSSSTRDGTVFGWLMELGMAGEFDQAARVFRSVCDILDRLARLDVPAGPSTPSA